MADRSIRIRENDYYWKNRVIDIGGSEFVPPDTDIYDEPTRSYKANLQWSQFIEGIVSWLAESSAWQESGNRHYEQQILTFIEGVESGEIVTLTKEELIEVVCAGMECHTDELARRWLLASSAENIRNGASISPDDASIVIDTAFDVPPNNSETANEARNGGMFAVASQFAKLLDKTADYIGNSYSQTLIAQLINVFIGSPVGQVTGLDTLIADYLLDFATEQITVSDIDELTEFLYCEGIQDGFISYLEAITVSETQLDYYLRFFALIPDTTLNRWYESGLATPLSNYFDYGCFIRDPLFRVFETYTNTLTDLQIPEYAGLSQRRYRVKLTGQLSNGTETWDGAYLNNAGTITRVDPQIFALRNGGTSLKTITVPLGQGYSEQGYSYIVEVSQLFGAPPFPRISVQLGTVLGAKGFNSGEIRIDLVDLGGL